MSEEQGMPQVTSERDEHRVQRSLDHIFHVWINQRQDTREKAGEEHESDLYEWKNALNEAQRLPQWLGRARKGELPTQHQQCSHSEVEPITENRLICAIGEDVTKCPILASLYATFADETRGQKFYAEITPDDVDTVAAKVCTWHIFMTALRSPHSIDTSEGYVQDEGDRRFWARVYDNLSAADVDPEDDVPEGEGFVYECDRCHQKVNGFETARGTVGFQRLNGQVVCDRCLDSDAQA